jgi:hypothetical protein
LVSEPSGLEFEPRPRIFIPLRVIPVSLFYHRPVDPVGPVCGRALASRQEGECWNGLKGLHPLPYHLGFMIGLTSGVPPSQNKQKFDDQNPS